MLFFGLQYALVVAGYAATAFLLGSYMARYARATDFELGLIFAIQPAAILVRPLACSLADRLQSHRAIYLYCALVSCLCHLPFILAPFACGGGDDFNGDKDPQQQQQPQAPQEKHSTGCGGRALFWLLVAGHTIGCLCFCCMRTLGDVLTVNYCRRARASAADYTKYRKFGPISFGVCSLLLGQLNTRPDLHGLPDFVPGFLLYSTCHLALFLLLLVWPPQFFHVVSESQLAVGARPLAPLPSARETWRHIRARLRCQRAASRQSLALPVDAHSEPPPPPPPLSSSSCNDARLSLKQQAQILGVLVRHDARLPLFLAILAGCGVCGHSAQNFVYVYLAQVCAQPHAQCNASRLSGYIMAGICLSETLAYWLASTRWLRARLAKVRLALAVLVGHYLCLGSRLVTHHSAYFFLAECLHGLEFGLMVATSIEWADLFANQVSHVIPELVARKIIAPNNGHDAGTGNVNGNDNDPNGHQDQLDLVRVSLMATMMACFLLAYDGLGGVLGSVLYGLVVSGHGFAAAFRLNGMLAGALLVALLAGPSLLARLGVRAAEPSARLPAQVAEKHQEN